MLTLVRHGQTQANRSGLLLGRADPPLCAQGVEQAAVLARALPRPARLVSSPLTRARQTAEMFGVPVEVDERWIEMDYGTLDGCPSTALDAAGWRAWRDDPAHVPAGGESVAAVGERVRAACADLAADAASDDVVVVSHVSPIKAAIAWALGVGDEVAWRMWVEDAAVCRIDTSGSTPRLLAFNDLSAHAAALQPLR
ncbi:histidine phosphatase family protein [Actinomycetospora termitidis]|uniref:Histidine phosphatase family protein n=1 Tax=Actinomycetospora termitidis TaxID=3053470 RepID=A0ABT7M7G1_9PSEU|nr:histidine phosphatase family protein [Actinomycetospora sp. Odt1-22]MDL5156590.1 histidine phosphatase family protein [Actinomycetospora sp. Odt1-22]